MNAEQWIVEEVEAAFTYVRVNEYEPISTHERVNKFFYKKHKSDNKN